MKKLLGLAILAAAGACASGSYDGGGGGMPYANLPEGRYYDCLDPNAYPCGYYDGYSPGAELARRTIAPAARRRPMARLVERADVGGAGAGIAGRTPEARAGATGDRMAIVHRASGGSPGGSSPAPSGSGSTSGPAPSVHSAPPPSFSAPPPAVSAPSSGASAPSAGSVHSSKQ